MRRAKVSIIIPVYNVEKFLARCLDSVLAQTYRNIEVICIDDGSEDKSPRILDNYQKQYNNISVMHQKNQGASMARNLGLKKATGEYVTFVDSDDEIKSDFVEQLVSAIKDGVIVISGHESLSAGGDMLYRSAPDPNSAWSPYKFIQLHGEMCRRDFLIQHRITFPADYQLDEDAFFTFNILAHADNSKVKVTNYIGYIGHINPNGITHRINITRETRNTKVLKCLRDMEESTAFSQNVPVDYRLFLYLKILVINLLLQRHLLTNTEYYQEYKKYFSWLKDIYAKYDRKLRLYIQSGETSAVNLLCNLFVLATKMHTAWLLLVLLNNLHGGEIN